MKASSIEGALTSVTKKYTSMRQKEERARRRFSGRSHYMYSTRITVKEVAWDVMEEAYMKVSSNGTLPAHARQIMYAARPKILEKCDAETFGDQYFTQTLLPDYIEEHGCHNWNVVYDARGHLYEPHPPKDTSVEIGIGTIAVSYYLADRSKGVDDAEDQISRVSFGDRYPTHGPQHRYGAVLFIEKEGFFPLFEEVDLAAKWDIAIMSNKGMSVVAGRELMSRLGVPVYVLHDLDGSGFSIIGTLKRGTRRFPHGIDNVIDLGLRMEDVEEYGLAAEPADNNISDGVMRRNGATSAEIEFVRTQRVELNAFASDDFIEWIEKKLTEHGVEKVIPDDDTLEKAYRRAAKAAYINERIKDLDEKAMEHVTKLELPDDLAGLVKAELGDLDGPTTESWDGVIAGLVGLDDEDNEAEDEA